jgi:NAD(P)-dependent dehydrogenase (short-subunit alcohol dehydrogenase family)
MTTQTPPRTLVMTGATSGIGLHALDRLTRQGGVRAIIGARSGHSAASGDVTRLPLDLASLASVRAFADGALATLDGTPIDMLVLNAGTQYFDNAHVSEDGYELTFAVNHLAHYLLAQSLLPALARDARIVITTSDTHDPRIFRNAPDHLDVQELAHPARTGGAAGIRAYAASKLCNILTAQSLARLDTVIERYITVIAFNPGLTGGTGLARTQPAVVRGLMSAARPVFLLLARFRDEFHMGTPERAGEALASIAGGTVTPPPGHIYASLVKGQLTYPAPSALAQDPDARDRLWAASADMVESTSR